MASTEELAQQSAEIHQIAQSIQTAALELRQRAMAGQPLEPEAIVLGLTPIVHGAERLQGLNSLRAEE